MSLYRWDRFEDGSQSSTPYDSTEHLDWDSNSTSPEPRTVGPTKHPSFCLWLLVHTIGRTNIGIWDLVLLVPNSIFLLFLVFSLRHSVARLKEVRSPIYSTFFTLVSLTCLFATIRCIVTMSAPGFNTPQDQILWLVSRFFQLMMELSVLMLAFLFGHLDSASSTQRVLTITVTISLAYVFTQGILQHTLDKEYFNMKIYTHGGMQFWFGSSVFFFVVYALVVLLRCTKTTECYGNPIPQKSRFYYYATFLLLVNVLQACGSSLVLFKDATAGFCLVDLTTFFYFGLYAPVTYIVFLLSVMRLGTKQNEHSPLLDISYYPSTPPDMEDSRGADDDGSVIIKRTKSNQSSRLNYDTQSLSTSMEHEGINISQSSDRLMLTESEEFERSYAFRTPLERSANFQHVLSASYQSAGSLDLSSDASLG